jgi:predicted component of type VI protein secretion system
MDDEVLNYGIRKFLKKVGITAQMKIEESVRDAVREGRLDDVESLTARMVLTVGGVDLEIGIDGDIPLTWKQQDQAPRNNPGAKGKDDERQ